MIGLTLFFLATLELLSLPMALVVFKYVRNHCGDWVGEALEQFHVSSSSLSRGHTDDFSAASSWASVHGAASTFISCDGAGRRPQILISTGAAPGPRTPSHGKRLDAVPDAE